MLLIRALQLALSTHQCDVLLLQIKALSEGAPDVFDFLEPDQARTSRRKLPKSVSMAHHLCACLSL